MEEKRRHLQAACALAACAARSGGATAKAAKANNVRIGDAASYRGAARYHMEGDKHRSNARASACRWRVWRGNKRYTYLRRSIAEISGVGALHRSIHHLHLRQRLSAQRV